MAFRSAANEMIPWLLRSAQPCFRNALPNISVSQPSTTICSQQLAALSRMAMAARQSTRLHLTPKPSTVESRRGMSYYISGYRRIADPMYAVYGLIGANCLGYLAWRTDPAFMKRHFVVSVEDLRQGRIYTLLTSGFSHYDGWHLTANMIGLYFFGRDIAYTFGGRKLVALYCVGAVAGSLAHVGYYWWQQQELRRSRGNWFRSPTPGALGASAAVNAIMVVDILLYPTRLILLYGIIPLPAWALGLAFVASDISGATGGHGNIGYQAHLGGAAVGAAFYWAYRRRFIRRI